jgi:hypothetical protein
MDSQFFERPILNSPCEAPARHWELEWLGTHLGAREDFERKVAQAFDERLERAAAARPVASE